MQNNAKREIAVEIFPAEKSCAQGCPPCPMAKKETQVIATEIDPQVQESFSILEWVIKKSGETYDMHFANLVKEKAWLFPEIRFPHLINMARFETDNTVRNKNNAEDFSNELRKLFLEKNIHPTKVGFSIVPKNPLVTTSDIELVEVIINSIKKWFFDGNSKKIEATIRSNLIPYTLFQEIGPKSFQNDEVFIKPLIEKLKGDSGVVFNKYHETCNGKFPLIDNVYTHENHYIMRDQNDEITIFNRVISVEKSEDSLKYYKQQARFAKMLGAKKIIADFAIAPRGVMLMHSSFSINNPVLWITHSDFRKEILKRRWKKGFCVFSFMNHMIYENLSLYSILESRFENPVKLEEWKAVFELYRPQILKFIKDSDKKKTQIRKITKRLKRV